MPNQFDELIPNAKAARRLGVTTRTSPAGFELPNTASRKQPPVFFRGGNRRLAGEPQTWGCGTSCARSPGARRANDAAEAIAYRSGSRLRSGGRLNHDLCSKRVTSPVGKRGR
jgi:hypothetical protein